MCRPAPGERAVQEPAQQAAGFPRFGFEIAELVAGKLLQLLAKSPQQLGAGLREVAQDGAQVPQMSREILKQSFRLQAARKRGAQRSQPEEGLRLVLDLLDGDGREQDHREMCLRGTGPLEPDPGEVVQVDPELSSRLFS